MEKDVTKKNHSHEESNMDDLPAWQFLISWIFILSVPFGFYFGGIWTFLEVMLTFIAIPLFDYILGDDNYTPPSGKDKEKALIDRISYIHVVRSYVPGIVCLAIWSSYAFATYDLTLLERIGLTLSVGLLLGGHFTASHELAHRLNNLDRFLSKLGLHFSCYMHFDIEHVWGHHKHVGTPKDPATATLNESFYHFFPRTVYGSYLSAWRIEAHELKERKRPFYSIYNRMIWYQSTPILWIIFLYYAIGVKAVLFYLLTSSVSFVIFELINYVEHYGLIRREIGGGKYEKVNIMHSWNSNTKATNTLLIKLQRHSDHHVNATRPYQVLRHFDGPMLPFGYAVMFLIALIPPLWKKLMNPRVKFYREELNRRFPLDQVSKGIVSSQETSRG